MCSGKRKTCNGCSRSKLCEKTTRNELELKLKAIPFDGLDVNRIGLINSQEVEAYEYKYVVDYIFDETITRLLKNGLLVEEVDQNPKHIIQSQSSSIDNPIPESLTLENLQTISANGGKYVDNFHNVSHEILIEFVYNLLQECAKWKLLKKSGRLKSGKPSPVVYFCFQCAYRLPPPKTFHRVQLDCGGSGYIGYNYRTKVISISWKHKTHKMPKAKFKTKLKNS